MRQSYYMENTDRGFKITLDDSGYNAYGDTGWQEEAIGITCVVGFIIFLVVITIF